MGDWHIEIVDLDAGELSIAATIRLPTGEERTLCADSLAGVLFDVAEFFAIQAMAEAHASVGQQMEGQGA